MVVRPSVCTGKTDMLIAVGHHAIQHGHTKSATSPPLTSSKHLYRAAADNTVGETIDQLCRNDLIIIDEIGFAPPHGRLTRGHSMATSEARRWPHARTPTWPLTDNPFGRAIGGAGTRLGDARRETRDARRETRERTRRS